jgi:LysM repeat protein
MTSRFNTIRHLTTLFLVLVVFSLTNAHAQTRIHEVKQGETLVSIAQAYQMTATELRVLNKLPNERIEIGQKLRVRDVEPISPSSSTQATSGVGIDPSRIESQVQRDTTQRMTRGVETPRTADTLRTNTTTVVQPKPEPQLVEREHLVQPGETLFGIANQYGMLVADLKRRNGIVGNDVTAGQRLKVLAPDTTSQELKQVQVQPPVQETPPAQGQPQVRADDRAQVEFNPQKHEWYTVKTSDTLPSIARTFGMSIAQLRDLNGSMIYTMNAGDRIIVHRSSEIESERIDTSSSKKEVPPPTESVPPPAASQPPVVDLKPPVELVPPPAVVTETPVVKSDSTINAELVETFDPFGSVVNRGRFIGYVVKRNERLASILDTFQMDESDFYALNPSLDGRPPRAGVEVLVYEPPSNLQPNPYAVDATTAGVGLSLTASVYSDVDRGKLTASGELYNPENLTVASNTYPLGSILYLLNPESGKGTYVRVNDKSELDGIVLSRSAASVLGLNTSGTNRVVVSKEQ